MPGRLERIDAGQPFAVVVDFAHAPEALGSVLGSCASVPGRLIAVFGCIGERERPRPRGHGAGGGRLADFVVLTNDNPFREDPDAIIAEIAVGLREAGRGTRGITSSRIPDRREAIAHAFGHGGRGRRCAPGRQGHEQSIIIGDTVVPWDERRVARELLGEMFG